MLSAVSVYGNLAPPPKLPAFRTLTDSATMQVAFFAFSRQWIVDSLWHIRVSKRGRPLWMVVRFQCLVPLYVPVSCELFH